MSGNRWSYDHISTEQAEERIKGMYATHSALEIAEELGLKKHTVYNLARKLELPRKVLFFTPAEDEYIRANYREKGNTPIGKHLGKNPDSIKHRMEVLGLSRSKKEISALRKLKNAGQFSNKQLPHNTKAKGLVTLHSDGTYWISTSDKKGTEQYRHYLYKQKHGLAQLPKGHVVLLNQTAERWQDIDADKLLLITRAELSKRNKSNTISPVIFTDRHIAGLICKSNGIPIEQMLERKDIINAKRAQILLQKQLKKNGIRTVKNPT